MGLVVGLLILFVLALPLALAIARANELFVVEVDNGTPHLLRGRLPQRLLNDLSDVTARPKIAHAKLRVVSEDGRPRLIVASGDLSDGQIQQLRNVVGMYRVQEIKSGGKRG
jgi:Protein of unknown function (DUF3634)